MFKIDRRSTPKWMQSREFVQVGELLAEFHAKGGTRGLQERFPLEHELAPFDVLILEALRDQFGGLCAYSEVASDPGRDDPAHRLLWHRPTNDAASLDGKVDYEHYWWLTLDWDNWYLASAFIESVKSYQFPVAGDRIAVETRGALDTGLLLDPCEDEPTWWLDFRHDGSVRPRQHPSSAEQERFDMINRGALTIRILDLDNDMLRSSRRTAIRDLESSELWKRPGPDVIDHVIDEPRPHRAALLQHIISDRVVSKIVANDQVDVAALERLVDRVPEMLGAQLLADGIDGKLDDVSMKIRNRLAKRLLSKFHDLPIDDHFNDHPVDPARLSSSRPRAGITPTKKPAKGAPTAKRRPEVSIGLTDRITRVLIKNFRAIQQVDLTIDSELVNLPPKVDASGRIDAAATPTAGTQWKALLGENGSGKSSILHAIALALTGDRLDEFCAAAGLDWSDMLRRADEDIQGRILLEFTGGQKIDLRFTKSTAWFHGLNGGAPAMHANVRAYGATRLLRRPLVARDEELDTAEALQRAIEVLLDESADRSKRLAAASDSETLLADLKGGMTVHARSEAETTIDIGNLLDPSVPVINATSWLLDLAPPEFNVAALTLSDLLGHPSAVRDRREREGRPRARANPRIERKKDADGKAKVFVDGDSLAHVSDGYRSVIAVACDIMRGIGGLDVSGGVSDLARARGIVLIDEVGAHLHPSWRMQITDRLRRAFPNVQFLISTHEPLCLRGLQENEVVKVLKYERFGVVLQEIEMSPARYRVDQLLTSDFFGLDSAIDPELDALFRRYYELRRDQQPEDPVSDELLELDRTLHQQRLRPVLGYTRRDQLMYEAIDTFLATQPTIDNPDERQRMRQETVDKVADQWLKMTGLRR